MWPAIRRAIGQVEQPGGPAAMFGRASSGPAWDVEGLEGRQLLTADLAALACGFCQSAAESLAAPDEAATDEAELWSPEPEFLSPGGTGQWDVAEPLGGPLMIQSLELTAVPETFEPLPVALESPEVAASAGPVSASDSKPDASLFTERGVMNTRPGLAPLQLIPDRSAEDLLPWQPESALDQPLEPIDGIPQPLETSPADSQPPQLGSDDGRLEQLAGRGRLASSLQPATQSPLHGIQNTLGWLTDEEYRRLIGGDGRGRLDHFEPAAVQPTPEPWLSRPTLSPGGQAWPESVNETQVPSQPFNLRLGIRNWLSSWNR
jgi:hypothetical protein